MREITTLENTVFKEISLFLSPYLRTSQNWKSIHYKKLSEIEFEKYRWQYRFYRYFRFKTIWNFVNLHDFKNNKSCITFFLRYIFLLVLRQSHFQNIFLFWAQVAFELLYHCTLAMTIAIYNWICMSLLFPQMSNILELRDDGNGFPFRFTWQKCKIYSVLTFRFCLLLYFFMCRPSNDMDWDGKRGQIANAKLL